MKKQLGLLAFILALATATSVAQCPYGGQGAGNGNKQKAANEKHVCVYGQIPDLTDAQQLQIDKIKLEQKKAALEIKTEIDAKRAKLMNLVANDNPDPAAIDKLIDEMGKLKADQQKKHVASMIEIRKLLTEEQKVYFDSHILTMGFGQGPGGKGCAGGK